MFTIGFFVLLSLVYWSGNRWNFDGQRWFGDSELRFGREGSEEIVLFVREGFVQQYQEVSPGPHVRSRSFAKSLKSLDIFAGNSGQSSASL